VIYLCIGILTTNLHELVWEIIYVDIKVQQQNVGILFKLMRKLIGTNEQIGLKMYPHLQDAYR